MIYLDNAATTFPKPPEVYDAANGFMRAVGASPGRSAHLNAVKAGRVVFSTRERLASLFNVRDAGRIVFTANATEALNMALLALAWFSAWSAVAALGRRRPTATIPRAAWSGLLGASIFASLGLANHHATAILLFPILLVEFVQHRQHDPGLGFVRGVHGRGGDARLPRDLGHGRGCETLVSEEATRARPDALPGLPGLLVSQRRPVAAVG